MTLTETYRKQHQELVQLVVEFSDYLNPEKIRGNKAKILEMLSILTSKINIHLAMEDRALYPRLIQSNDAQVAETASRFQNEMGAIKNIYGDYIARWSTGGNFLDSAENFISETQEIFRVLAQRIEKENETLYPLADKIQEDSRLKTRVKTE